VSIECYKVYLYEEFESKCPLNWVLYKKKMSPDILDRGLGMSDQQTVSGLI